MNQRNDNGNNKDSIQIQFYDGNGNVRKDLYDTEAERIANEIAQDMIRKGKKEEQIRNAQIRRFFNEVKLYERLLKVEPEKRPVVFAAKLPEIKMLKAKSAYALSRETINHRFANFISKGVDQVKTVDDFFVFAKLFEAVVGFVNGRVKK